MKEELLNKIHQGDCLEFMKQLPDKCIDLIITDPPYGTTGLEWDEVADFEEMWKQFYRILRGRWVVVMFASQPFTTDLIQSNRHHYRYNWVWDKKIGGNPMLAKYQPLKTHEDIVVFAKNSTRYFPIMKKGLMRKKGGGKSNLLDMEMTSTVNDDYFPKSVLEFSNAKRGEHPTQKPLDLMKYLVETYSEKIYPESDIIFDPFAGSGTTLVAAKQLGRKFLGCELSEKYVAIANERLKQDYLF